MSQTSVPATTEVVVMNDTINTTTTSSKLTSLRALMKDRNIDIYLIPSDDPHLSGTDHFVCRLSRCVGSMRCFSLQIIDR